MNNFMRISNTDKVQMLYHVDKPVAIRCNNKAMVISQPMLLQVRNAINKFCEGVESVANTDEDTLLELMLNMPSHSVLPY